MVKEQFQSHCFAIAGQDATAITTLAAVYITAFATKYVDEVPPLQQSQSCVLADG